MDNHGHDVTGQTLHAVEAFADLLWHLPAAMFLADADGCILEVNDAMVRMFKYGQPADLVGVEVTSLFADNDARSQWPIDDQIPQPISVRLRRQDGSIFAGSLFGRVVRDIDGRVLSQSGCLVSGVLTAGDVQAEGEPGIGEASDRSRIERELREIEERIRSITDSSLDWIWEVDAQGRYTYCSPRVTDILGYSVDEVLGKTLFDLMPPAEADRIRGVFEKSCDKHESIRDVVNVNIAADGSEVVLESSGSPFFDAEGNLCGYRGIDRNITDRRRAEEALRESEATLKGLLEAAPTGIGLVRNRELIWINEQVGKMVGYTTEELTGKSARILYESQEEFERVGREKYGQIAADGVGSVETRWRCKSGEGIDIFLSSARVEPPGGEAGFIFTALDITDRKKAEQDLIESEHRYRQLVELMQEGLVVCRSNFDFMYVNERFANMLGYEPEEMIDRHLLEFISDDERENMQEQLDLRENGHAGRYETVWLAKDGSHVHTINSPCSLADEAGNFIGSFAVVTDISDRLRVEQEALALAEQLRQAQKMEAIGRLAGGVAHDFNNQLTVIRGYCDMLLLSLKSGDAAEVSLKEIKKAAERSGELTRKLLAFSRKQALEAEVFNPYRILDELERTLTRMLGEEIDLSIAVRGQVGNVKVDRSQFEQAVINLSINSRDAMPGGGKLTITVGNVDLAAADPRFVPGVQPGPYVRIDVADTGKGMDDEVLQQVFEPFFTTKEAGKGTGLGLSMVYGFVKQSGGYILADSSPGNGAIFSIFLPCVRVAEEEGGPEVIEPAAGGNETILVAEDDDTVRRFIVRMLRHSGYEVLEAAGPAEAMELAEAHEGTLDLLISDVVMPQMRGPQLAGELQKARPGLPVLYISCYAEEATIRDVRAAGATFLPKPFGSDALEKAVRQALTDRAKTD